MKLVNVNDKLKLMAVKKKEMESEIAAKVKTTKIKLLLKMFSPPQLDIRFLFV